MIYIGHTFLPLKKRFQVSKTGASASKKKKKRSKFYQHMIDIGTDKFSIELVELCSCLSKRELREREQYHIDKCPQRLSLNMNRTILYKREYKPKTKVQMAKQRDFSSARYIYQKTWGGCKNVWGSTNLLRIDVALFE